MLWITLGLLLMPDSPTSEQAASAPRADALAYVINLTIAVEKPEQTSDKLVALTAELGGYFARRDQHQLVLKVPRDKRQALIDTALEQGLMLSRSEQARDLSSELLQTRTLLKSREAVLGKYFDIMIGAQFQAVLQVEQQITSLVQEIEGLKGRLQKMEHELQYAVITVQFQFKQRRPPRRDGNSPFPWLNTVNLVDVLEGYQ